MVFGKEIFMTFKEYLSSIGFSEKEQEKILKTQIRRDVSQTNNIINGMQKVLGCNMDEIKHMIYVNPIVVHYTTSLLEKKIQDYPNLLKTTPENVKQMICSCSSIIGYDTEKVIPQKLEKYSKLLNLPIEKIYHAVIKRPQLLTYKFGDKNKTSVENKLKILSEFMTSEEILEHPIVLSYPPYRVKFRYMILSYCTNHHKSLEKRHLMSSEDGLYAKMKFLEDEKMSMGGVIYSRADFKRMYGKDSDHLINRYPLTGNSIFEVEQKYKQKTGKELLLTQEEINEVLN